MDNAGNVSASVSATITLDTVAPAGSIAIDSDATYAITSAVTLTLSASDSTSGVAHMQFSNDTANWSGWEAYTTTKTWTLVGGDGTKTVYVQYRDNAGNAAVFSDTVILDSTPPSSVVSALPTYQTSVTFTIAWVGADAASGLATYDVQYREGSGDWTDLITATTALATTITGQDGRTYGFRARARDNVGNVGSYALSDTQTTVDVTPPTASSLILNGGAFNSAAVNVTLSLSATDGTSGVAEMGFSNDGLVWSDWRPYSTSASWLLAGGDGPKTVHGRFRDTAGNLSSIVSDTIELDTTVATDYGVTVNEGALFTNKITVTLSIGAQPGTPQMKVSNDGGFANTQWEPYNSRKAWTITQFGSYVIPRVAYVRHGDINGNVLNTSSDDIILDVNPPTGSIAIVGSSSRAARRANATVTLNLSATDDVSGVGGMMLSNQSDFAGASWETYATSHAWTFDSNNTVYVRFRDNAGNVSQTYSAVLESAQQRIYLPSLNR